MLAHLPYVAVGVLGALIARQLGRPSRRTSFEGPPPMDQGAPFARGSADPVWPIRGSKNKRWREVAYKDVNGKTHGNASRRFKATRTGDKGERWHVGIDLYANAGDIVVAPESGIIIEDQNYLATIPGEDALLLQGDHGVTFILGEIVADSWHDFGVKVGDRVSRGQPIARVALTSKGSHMLHFETMSCCPTTNQPWYKGKPLPPNVLDPTEYLLRARSGSALA